MDYVWRYSSSRIALGAMAIVIGVLAAIGAAAYRRGQGRTIVVPAARILAVTTAVVIFLLTTWNGVGAGGDLVWEIGAAGLGDWRQSLERFPDTMPSVLLVGNVLLYMPLGFLAAIGWRRQPWSALGACISLSLAIEIGQWLALRGVGASDDVLLNGLGAAIGWLLGLTVTAAPWRPQVRRSA